MEWNLPIASLLRLITLIQTAFSRQITHLQLWFIVAFLKAEDNKMTTAEPPLNYPFFKYQQAEYFSMRENILYVPKDRWDGCCYPP